MYLVKRCVYFVKRCVLSEGVGVLSKRYCMCT